MYSYVQIIFLLHCRVVELALGNQKLREQLRESQETNQRLVEDIHELTFRWRETMTRLEEGEKGWQEKMENQATTSAQANHSNLSAVTQEVAEIKTKFDKVVSSVQK